jgi:hypothetical protein
VGNIELWVILNFTAYGIAGCREKVAAESIVISRLSGFMIFFSCCLKIISRPQELI